VQNVRRQFNNQASAESSGFKMPTMIAFKGLSDSMHHPSDVEASIPQVSRRGNATPLVLIPDSDSESDIKSDHSDVYSPYYSPLQARKRPIQELEEMRSAYRFRLSSFNAWLKGPMDRRSSL
jgi:hypothetical protein